MENELDNELRKLTKLDLNINQLKVIREKYLKNSPTIEEWIRTVCHNISLSEILHSKKISDEEIFKDINCEIIEDQFKDKKIKTYLLHKNILDHNERGKNFKKFIKNLEEINKEHPEITRKRR